MRVLKFSLIAIGLLGGLLGGAPAAEAFQEGPASKQRLLASGGSENSVEILAIPARLEVEEVSLREALEALHEASGVPLVFSPTLVPLVRVTCDCRSLTVGEALKRLLERTELEYFAYGSQVVVAIKRDVPRLDVRQLPPPPITVATSGVVEQQAPTADSVANAQEGTITGTVEDARTGAPLAGVQIQIDALAVGVFSREDGRYLIPNVPAGTHTVTAGRIGYATLSHEVIVAAGETVVRNFRLTPQALGLDEIVVTGTPGGMQRRAIGHSVARLDVTDLRATSGATDLGQLLTATAPGVIMEHTTGMVGSGPMISVRGASTLSLADAPLIYVDGIRVDNRRNTGNWVPQGMQVSRLNDINPEDIESIEIIRGPAAATLYGTEASNGVIQIITKRGSTSDRPEVSVSIRQGARWLHDPAGRWPTPVEMIDGELVELNLVQTEADRGTPLFTTGHTQGYGVNVRGGTSTVHYYVSGDYDRQEGVMFAEGSRRLAGRANLGLTLSERLTVNASHGITRSHLSYNPYSMTFMSAAVPSHCQAFPNARCFLNHPPDPYYNNHELWQDTDRFTSSIGAVHRPTDWLTHRITLGLDAVRELDVRLQKRADSVGLMFFTPAVAAGRRDEQRVSSTNFSVDYSATVSVPINSDIESSTSMGLQYYLHSWALTGASGEDFAARGLTTINAAGRTSAFGDHFETSTVGTYVQQQFGLHDRLFFTAALRADDNSAFGEDFSIVLYPKLSASWVLSEEPFWDVSWVDALLLRAAFGGSGQAPARFAALRTYAPTATGSGASSFIPQGVGNPELGPERGQEFELGVEASLLEGRIGMDLTLYDQRIKEAILARNVAPSEGFAGTQFVNAGEVKNAGVELLLTGRVVERPRFAWDLGLNLSHNKNEIVHLGDDSSISLGTWNMHVPGYPVGAYFMRNPVQADLDESGRAINVMCDGGPENDHRPMPCDEAPRVFLGPISPPTEASLTSELRLGSRTRLNMRVDTKRGMVRENIHVRGNCSNRSACLERIFPEQFDPARIAQVQLYPDLSTYVIEDATFTRLREVSLNYQLPEAWLGPFGAQRGSVTLAARNLALWTNFQGWDPETFVVESGEQLQVRRGSRNATPLPMSVQMSINLTY